MAGRLWEYGALCPPSFDSVIQIAPLTCGPEIVAEAILQVSAAEIPVMTIYVDEQTGKPVS